MGLHDLATDQQTYGLLQDFEYSSLCYTVGPCCLVYIF